MTKTKINPQMIRQIKQVSNEVILEENKSSFDEAVEVKENKMESINQEKVNQLKAQKEAWAKKRIQEIENEMKLLKQKRQEELKKRYEQKPEEQKQKEIYKERMKKSQVPEVATKPKRFLFWVRRIKTAQQQAQPETAGRRIGG